MAQTKTTTNQRRVEKRGMEGCLLDLQRQAAIFKRLSWAMTEQGEPTTDGLQTLPEELVGATTYAADHMAELAADLYDAFEEDYFPNSKAVRKADEAAEKREAA